MDALKKEIKRKFLGKIDDFKSKEEKHFYDRMLRAYLKGGTQFNYGLKYSWPTRIPKAYAVQQSYL